MTNNSYVLLKGVRQPVFLSKAHAEQLQKIFANENLGPDHNVTIGTRSFIKREIRLIEILPDSSRIEENDRQMQAFYDEEKINRKRMLEMTPSAKAQKLDMFAYLYRNTVGTMPSQEVLEQARTIQENFFIANPKRTLCDPRKLSVIIPKDELQKLNIWQKAYFRVVERAVARDMDLAEKP